MLFEVHFWSTSHRAGHYPARLVRFSSEGKTDSSPS
ncbi:MAG: hypothetical protein ACI8RZ_007338, partial [Myxococcota bacterium]